MRVSVIAGFYPPDVRGGGEISGKLLVESLSSAGAEVNVLTCGADPRTDIEGSTNVRRIKSPNIYWSFQSDQPWYRKAIWHFGENFNPRSRAALKCILKALDPHIVVTNTIQNFGAEAWNAPEELGIPVVHVLRGYYPFCWRSSAVRNGKNCTGRCLDCGILTYGRRRASQNISGVIGTSNYVLERHIAEGLFQNAHKGVIPVPLAADMFARQRRNSHSARFGYLGVLSSDKGLEVLASAWSRVDPTKATLLIAGHGSNSYVEAIRQKFSPSVTFLGWADGNSFLETIDYLIVPSTWNEPFGRVVIEAFAKAVPVLGSSIGGIAETIQDGQNGFLFAPGNCDQLLTLIDRAAQLSQDDYKFLSEKALNCSQSYESSRIARAHIDFYSRVIDCG